MSTTITKENLPPTPTHDDNLLNPSFHSPLPLPPLPPKPLSPALPDTPPNSDGLRPLLVDDTASNQDLNTHPGTPPSPDARAKRPNLLVDLIETEKLYVDQMAGVIRKVASAWSRTNLPPHELDLMFRSIEGVYKADRSLLSRLKEIGTNPSSPKALGDLLMRWIGDLETPYTTYCERYCSGFDAWEHVRDNTRLPDVLATFSATLPPPTASSSSPASPVWTLDELFLLPKGRLKYFKKLYGRLLKGTQPGRSDYKLLAGAAETLDKLLGILDARASVKAGSSTPTAPGD
ncbi:Dbl homology domain-containing protein [Lactarius deliciosus]|nr:Dbl homology domain-containing protein [Lactarius deliciosus]